MTAIITPPTGILFGPNCGIGTQRYEGADESETDGSSEVRLRGRPRWIVTLVPPAKMFTEEAALWESMVLKLKGKTNVLAAYDVVRQAPVGNMRGTLTLSSAAALGDEVLHITGGAGQAGKTLKAGDWLQVGTGFGTSQYFKVLDNATANGSGVIDVNVYPGARLAFTSGAAVTWDKPVVYCRQTTDRNTWTYSGTGRLQNGFALDLREVWK